MTSVRRIVRRSSRRQTAILLNDSLAPPWQLGRHLAVQGQWRWFRFGVIVLAAMAVPVAAGCQNDGGINAGVGGQGPGGGGSSAAAGGGAGARGGAGGSAAADGGVTPTDGGGPGGWVDLSPCHFPSTIPPGYRTDPMTTFDPDRGKLVVYGGHDGYSDVWDVDVATGLRTDRTTCAQVGVIPKADGVLVYDAGRKRVVLFSGAAAGDVREWDPVVNVWTDRPPPSTSPGAVPTGRPRAAVFDATRGRAIVFIVDFAAQSLALSVWEWNGVTGAWTLRQASLPVTYPLGVPSLAFDAGRGVVWGFGGADALGTQIDRLWTWNVTTAEFVDLTPAARPVAWPPGRAGAGLAYDATRGKLVLYGGWVGAVTRRDLWEWDAAAAIWVNRTPADVSATGATLPPGVLWPLPDVWSSDHVFADPAHGRVVLLHVVDLQSTGHSGAWLWNGERGTWSEATADTPPAAWPMSVSNPATAWDDDDRALFLSRNGELWRWTPADDRWEVLAWHEGMGAPNSLPAWLDGAAIAYDAKARKVVLFGGTVFGTVTTPSVLTDDLWLWDPATARLSKVSRPPGAAWPEPRREHALAYDPVRQRLLLFGGGKPEASRELWELDTATTTWRDLSGAAAGAAWPEADGTRPGPRSGAEGARAQRWWQHVARHAVHGVRIHLGAHRRNVELERAGRSVVVGAHGRAAGVRGWRRAADADVSDGRQQRARAVALGWRGRRVDVAGRRSAGGADGARIRRRPGGRG